ncbi:hypothetical protein NB476_02080 [Vibrio sp. RM-44-3]|uniref:Uncharacterized protein n=1 Tax=Vibrio campbellii TaxID=680 RepID=A0AAQ2XZD2_9VIBR|nr:MULTISPECIES: hypothetical protein [Vibrio]EJU9841477.1 hypothetical protein [Vibrio parahaemolyticus]EKO5219709.1 hypothetical protein [Vibrio parahaemolyticus]ELB2269896.1 hypothetical protein [Vibrio parahaemolyticus]MBM5082186.1 hypothetical protein [Vibrio parahaemolyticus]MCR9549954.1 hypothetical protein [Vibrio sp. RM-41-2A]
MSTIDKQTRAKIEATTEKMADVFLPYELTDRIIEEVMKNGRKSREAVMLMILEHSSKVIKTTDNGRKELIEAIKNNKV